MESGKTKNDMHWNKSSNKHQNRALGTKHAPKIEYKNAPKFSTKTCTKIEYKMHPNSAQNRYQNTGPNKRWQKQNATLNMLQKGTRKHTIAPSMLHKKIQKEGKRYRTRAQTQQLS